MYLSFSKQFSSQMFKTKTEFLVPILIYFPPSLIVKLNKNEAKQACWQTNTMKKRIQYTKRDFLEFTQKQFCFNTELLAFKRPLLLFSENRRSFSNVSTPDCTWLWIIPLSQRDCGGTALKGNVFWSQTSGSECGRPWRD